MVFRIVTYFKCLLPTLHRYLLKYTVALGLVFKEKKYLSIFKLVWKGAMDGRKDTKGVLKSIEEKNFDYKKDHK